MTTVLKRYKDAYATMTVAVYEPLIVQWYSAIAVAAVADSALQRAEPVEAGRAVRAVGSRAALRAAPSKDVIERVEADPAIQARRGERGPVQISFGTDPDNPLFREFPMLEVTNEAIFPMGRMDRQVIRADGTLEMIRDDAVPVLITPSAGGEITGVNVKELRTDLVKAMVSVLREGLDGALPADALRDRILAATTAVLAGKQLKPTKSFQPVQGSYVEFLSPIGIAQFYRQLYYHLEEGVGPIEQAFTVAPKETLEVVLETVRRQSHEEVTEMGSEAVSESAVESKNLDEVSDKVATMVERDSTAGMSANTSFSASGNIGVWQAGGSASLAGQTSLSQSATTSNELAKRKLKEVTKRASERITKTFSLRVRDTTDFTTTNLTRRVISNESAQPVSYGLRRVFNRVKVQVQALGPTLVWQLYLREPGAGLARSQFVHFAETAPVAPVNDPPALRPRPAGGTDTGTQSASIKYDFTHKASYVTLVVRPGPDRRVTAINIESITDLEHLAKDDLAPSPRNDLQWGSVSGTDGSFQVNIGVLPGDAYSVSVSYSFVWEPSPAVVQAWEDERTAAEKKFAAAEAEAREKALRDQFERHRALITARSKIRARPSADLRREERYEVLNRMVSHLFRPTGMAAAPSPLEIELFSRYFDVDAIFLYLRSSWWRPRYVSPGTSFGRPEYPITAESEPAPLGSSLGWLLQLDGDSRRNEFLNSPWVRVCVPIRAGRERAAVAWLAAHIEGELGYDPAKDPLKSLLDDIEKRRDAEQQAGAAGPDYITVDSSVGAPNQPLTKIENVFPVVDEFETTLPTEGFVYDELDVQIP